MNDISFITTKQETVPIRFLCTVHADIKEYVRINFEILHSYYEKNEVKGILSNFGNTIRKETFFEVLNNFFFLIDEILEKRTSIQEP